MVIKTASPGVIINEVDLTRGTSDAITTNVGGMVGPFQKGPVDELVLIETEAELQRTFGDPTPENYEYWYTISNFLEYGGVCYVIRCDDASGGSQTMKNACNTGTAPYVKNRTDFLENYYLSAGTCNFLAKTPGAWGNALGVAVIDAGADIYAQLSTTGIRLTSTATPFLMLLSSQQLLKLVLSSLNTRLLVLLHSLHLLPGLMWQWQAQSASITLSGEQTIDGVTTSSSRILVAGQSNAAENGIYVYCIWCLDESS